jgi:flagellar basal-body rod protein FlgG
MIRGLYTAASGLITCEAKQDTITSNIANLNTVGYKSDNLVIKPFEEVLISNYDKIVGKTNVKNTIGSLTNGSKIDQTITAYTEGPLQDTDKETDFAIEGRGFFTVSRNNLPGGAQEYYTRDGHFRVDGQGYLVNDSGDNVLGVNANTGTKEPMLIGNRKISSDPAGNIYLDGVLGYNFSTADFQDYNTLKKVGDNLFQGNNPTNAQVNIKQKTLEKSNVNSINEILNMMSTMRTFESNQKIIQAMDETLGKAVNEVGAVR